MRIVWLIVVLGFLHVSATAQTGSTAAKTTNGEPINVAYKPVSVAETFRPSAGRPGTWPGVILISDSTGLDGFLRSRASELAKEGFLVVAMDPRLNIPSTDPRDPPHERALREVGGAVAYLNNWMMNPTKVALVGYGTGGSLALDFAIFQDSVRAVVVNYAALPVGDPMLPHLHAKLLMNQAALDPGSSAEQNNRFLSGVRALHLHADMKVYPNVKHGFDRVESADYVQVLRMTRKAAPDSF